MAESSLAPDALRRWVVDLWRAAGSDAGEAWLTADHLVGANLAGHDSHGVGMLPRYVQAWLAGELQLNRHAAVSSDSPLASQAEVSLAQLSGYPLILFPADYGSGLNQSIEQLYRRNGFIARHGGPCLCP